MWHVNSKVYACRERVYPSYVDGCVSKLVRFVFTLVVGTLGAPSGDDKGDHGLLQGGKGAYEMGE
jgi:hypothetical protein